MARHQAWYYTLMAHLYCRRAGACLKLRLPELATRWSALAILALERAEEVRRHD